MNPQARINERFQELPTNNHRTPTLLFATGATCAENDIRPHPLHTEFNRMTESLKEGSRSYYIDFGARLTQNRSICFLNALCVACVGSVIAVAFAITRDKAVPSVSL